MKTYIGTKIVKAEPCSKDRFEYFKRYGTFPAIGDVRFLENKIGMTLEQGYMVEYEDGYKSWSPKDTFERCYREVTESEKKLLC